MYEIKEKSSQFLCLRYSLSSNFQNYLFHQTSCDLTNTFSLGYNASDSDSDEAKDDVK